MREGYSKGIVLTPTVFGELDLIFIKINASGRVAADSSPDTTVGSPTSGAYPCTFPKAVRGWVLSATDVNVAANAQVTAFNAQAGTITVDTGSDLSGDDECHILIALSRKDASVAG